MLVVAAALFLTLAPVYPVTNSPPCIPFGGHPTPFCFPPSDSSTYYESVSCIVFSIGVTYVQSNYYTPIGSPSGYLPGCRP